MNVSNPMSGGMYILSMIASDCVRQKVYLDNLHCTGVTNLLSFISWLYITNSKIFIINSI